MSAVIFDDDKAVGLNEATVEMIDHYREKMNESRGEKKTPRTEFVREMVVAGVRQMAELEKQNEDGLDIPNRVLSELPESKENARKGDEIVQSILENMKLEKKIWEVLDEDDQIGTYRGKYYREP